MTDLGSIVHYLGIEIICTDTSIIIIQMIYIDQLLASYQMSNCNAASTSMVEGLSLLSAAEGFTLYDINITAYKCFTGVFNSLFVKLNLIYLSSGKTQ